MALAGSRVGSSTRAAIHLAAVAILLIASLSAAAQCGPSASRPSRIVSINACTDQLLYALADRSQIAALTRYAAQDDYSIFAGEIAASGLPLIRGGAEEVLTLKPDLVLAGTFTRRATRQLLENQGLRMELFPPARTVEETRRMILHAARIFGHPERGEALVARIDAALDAAPGMRARDLSVLQYQRRGFVSGPETLIGDVLSRLGVRNAAEELGVGQLGRAPLEIAIKARADGLILFDPAETATDQGAAMLLHPALRRIYPAERRISIPGRLFICAGPALPEAIAELQDRLAGLRPGAGTR